MLIDVFLTSVGHGRAGFPWLRTFSITCLYNLDLRFKFQRGQYRMFGFVGVMKGSSLRGCVVLAAYSYNTIVVMMNTGINRALGFANVHRGQGVDSTRFLGPRKSGNGREELSVFFMRYLHARRVRHAFIPMCGDVMRAR